MSEQPYGVRVESDNEVVFVVLASAKTADEARRSVRYLLNGECARVLDAHPWRVDADLTALRRAYAQACTNLATIRPSGIEGATVGDDAKRYQDALLAGWGGIEGWDANSHAQPSLQPDDDVSSQGT